MSLRVRFTRRAADKIERADTWWRQNRLAAPDAVRRDLDRAPEIVILQPGVGQRATHARLAGVRHIHVDRIHHHVYCRVAGDELLALRFRPSLRLEQPRL